MVFILNQLLNQQVMYQILKQLHPSISSVAAFANLAFVHG